jgi:hypothetical protein
VHFARSQLQYSRANAACYGTSTSSTRDDAQVDLRHVVHATICSMGVLEARSQLISSAALVGRAMKLGLPGFMCRRSRRRRAAKAWLAKGTKNAERVHVRAVCASPLPGDLTKRLIHKTSKTNIQYSYATTQSPSLPSLAAFARAASSAAKRAASSGLSRPRRARSASARCADSRSARARLHG